MELETREKPDTRRSNLTTSREIPRRTAPVPDRLQPIQRDLAFKNFGVMDTGSQDKKSVATSLVINGSVLALIVLLSFTTKKMVEVSRVETITAPVTPPPPPAPPKPVVKLPPPPIAKVTPPKPLINPPKVEVPDPPKVPPPVFKADPIPVKTPTPPAPKVVSAPPAPRPVAIQIAQAASVANNDQHPSPVRLGSMTNPINNTSGPAVSRVNLGNSGAPGMNAANSGRGPASPINIGGSGSPNGTNMAGRANSAVAIKGLNNGVAGGNGPLTGRPAGVVQIASNNPPPVIAQPTARPTAAATVTPKVLFKPRPEYTEEARQLHLEGRVSVKIHVSVSGSVQVLGVTSGLGHGLDQAAIRAAQGMRFQPALQNGQPVDWDGVVNINFQLA